MDRITEFTITRIKMQGFKSFSQDKEFHFGGGTSYISGANGQGKTTIADAIDTGILQEYRSGARKAPSGL